MAESIFGEKAVVPTQAALDEALQDTRDLWAEALALSGGDGEWKFYTKAAGWSFPVKQGKRTLYYLMPKAGWFRMTFVYGDRAVEAAKAAGLPDQVLQDLLQATPYVEGRSVHVDIRDSADLETMKKLLQLKLEY